MWAMIVLMGVLIVLVTDKTGKDPGQDPGGTGDDPAKGKTDPGEPGEDQLKPGADGKYTQEQLDVLLGKERDRLDIKAKDAEKRIEDEVAKRLKDEKERAEMSELQKTQADLQAANTERDALRQEAETQQKRAELADWVAANAGDLDRAWRGYLHQQLAEAPETETPENTLARVREERDQEQGGQTPGLGVSGRPGGQTKPRSSEDMNREIRKAAGRK